MKVNDMKLLILSDTHRSLGFAYDAIEKEHPDAVVHLGDHLTDAEDLSFACQEPDFYYVPGNCDYAPTVPQSLTLELDGVRIFVTHGHLYGVKRDLTALAGAADFVLCDVPCSGLGVISKKPDIKYKNIRDIAGLPEIQ